MIITISEIKFSLHRVNPFNHGFIIDNKVARILELLNTNHRRNKILVCRILENNLEEFFALIIIILATHMKSNPFPWRTETLKPKRPISQRIIHRFQHRKYSGDSPKNTTCLFQVLGRVTKSVHTFHMWFFTHALNWNKQQQCIISHIYSRFLSVFAFDLTSHAPLILT